MRYDVKDLSLSGVGKQRIEWVARYMPVIRSIAKRFESEKPLAGIRVTGCLHVTAETAVLMLALKAGGAEPVLCASNPLSTQNTIAANLVREHKIPVFAVKGEDSDTYYRHIDSALDHEPHITIDDGADLVTRILSDRKDLAEGIYGGTEETTTGVVRLKSMEREGVLPFPVIAVNDSQTKQFFDNRYGTGQSALDGIMRSTNILFAGRRVVVCGYGWCGRGLAHAAAGLNARVAIVEVNPIKALEAAMDGFEVMNMAEAAAVGEVFITVTGNKNVIRGEHIELMRDNVVLANAGHFNVEIDIEALEKMAVGKRMLRNVVTEYEIEGGRKVHLLAEGRLINLAAGEGHPACVMDMSFANQALAVEYLVRNNGKLDAKVHVLPREMDRQIALLKLKTMGIEIDTMSAEQEDYMHGWKEGT